MIILGSSSPRRIKLLKEITRDFIIMKPPFNERDIDIKAKDYALVEAKNKANSLKNAAKPQDFLICCDTMVIYEDIIFNKPVDLEDAKKTLAFLSGKTHKVITGYIIIHGDKTIERQVETDVTFNELDENTINEYVTKCDVLDKAGSYGIQYNDIVPIIKEIKGSLTNVIGFPIDEIKEDLLALGAL